MTPGHAQPRPSLGPQRILVGYWLRDHGWLRAIWSNFHQVDADLFRANHPRHPVLKRAKRLGVQAVLSLRGDADTTPNILERQDCVDIDLPLHSIRLQTSALPSADILLDLIHLLRTLPKPLLVHCKSGADRTGLAATLYLHVIKGVPLDRARRQLALRYAHVRFSKAGIVHTLLDAYDADHGETGVDFETWLTTRYDPAALTAAFKG